MQKRFVTQVRQAIAVFLTLLLAVSSTFVTNAQPIQGSITFNDIGDVYLEARTAIEKWADNEVIIGIGDGQFGPALNFKRSHMAIMMSRIMGYSAAAPNNFTDTPADHYATQHILQAVHAQVFDGHGAFRPQDYMTREEAAIAFARALSLQILPEDNGPTHFIDDADISEQARPAIHAILRHGVMQGFSSGADHEFRPHETMLRQDLTVMFSNAIDTILSDSRHNITFDRTTVINRPEVTLRSSIAERLIIAQGVGDGNVFLDNVKVNNEVIVRAEGATLYITGTSVIPIVRIMLDDPDASVAVIIEEGADVSSIIIEKGDTVTIKGSFDNIVVTDDNVRIVLDGSVQEMDLRGDNVTVVDNNNNTWQPMPPPMPAPANPRPTSTPAPRPALTPTPRPTPTPDSGSEQDSTPQSTPTPTPTPTQTPIPTSTPIPTPMPTSTPMPTPTPTPTPTPIPTPALEVIPNIANMLPDTSHQFKAEIASGLDLIGFTSVKIAVNSPPNDVNSDANKNVDENIIDDVDEYITDAFPTLTYDEFVYATDSDLDSDEDASDETQATEPKEEDYVVQEDEDELTYIWVQPSGAALVTWSIEGALHPDTKIDSNGLLYISDMETAASFTVRASLMENTAISATATVNVLPAPIPPTHVFISDSTATTTTVSWSGVYGVEYVVYRSNSVLGTQTQVAVVPVGVTSWTDMSQGDNSPLSQAYYYRVASRHLGIDSAVSEDFASREADFWGENVLIHASGDDNAAINARNQAMFREPGTGWHFFGGDGRTQGPPDINGRTGELHKDIFGNEIRGVGTETAQFGDHRYAFFFKSGDYPTVNFDVGFYTHIIGLGQVPTDTRIGSLSVTAEWRGTHGVQALTWPERDYIGNSTCNFWRTMENVQLNSNTMWGVSQAAPLRRLHVDGNLVLATNYSNVGSAGNWASGGFLSDSVITGTLNYMGQQQWFTRNTSYGNATGGQWNMVHLGTQGTRPAHGHNQGSWTVLPETPRAMEKPFLYIDDVTGHYMVFVPTLRENAAGPSWTSGNIGQGYSLSVLDDFYVAHADKDDADSINAALASGKHLIFTPGIYEITSTIYVNNPNTIVLGLGMASLFNVGNGFNQMTVGDVDGVRIAGLIFDAGESTNASEYVPVMLQVGTFANTDGDANNPVGLFDLIFRIGGATEARIGVGIEIYRQHAIGDNFWVWRADHGSIPWETGSKVGWFMNETASGTIINAHDFVMYALMNEHFHEYQLIWFGERGRLYFYQSELPYDTRTQEEWTPGPGTRGFKAGNSTTGFASYKVYDDVTQHEAWGIGIYAVPSNTGGTGWTQRNDYTIYILLENAIEVPDTPGVVINHACILNFANRPIVFNANYPSNGMPCPVRTHPRFIAEFGGNLEAALHPITGMVDDLIFSPEFPAIANVINGVGGSTWNTTRSGWVVTYSDGVFDGFRPPLLGTVNITLNGLSAPAISRNTEAVTIDMSFATGGTTIRYTTDGTTPTISSNVFTGPFTVSGTDELIEIRAAAFDAGGSSSAVASTLIGFTRSTNVALYQSARASSVNTGNNSARGAHRAVDGYGGIDNSPLPSLDVNRWDSVSNRNQFLIVDLGHEHDLSEIWITWQSGGGRLREGLIAFSNDPTVWTDATPWVSGDIGIAGARALNSKWTQLRTLTDPTNGGAFPGSGGSAYAGLHNGVTYSTVTLNSGARPRMHVDLSGENITARYILIDIRASHDFAPSIWALEVFAEMVDTVTVTGLNQPGIGDAGATSATTTEGHVISDITWSGAAGANFAAGEVPVASFTVTAAAGRGGFNPMRWADSTNVAGLGLISIPGAVVGFTRVSNTQINVTATFAPVAPRFAVTPPVDLEANGLTLSAQLRDTNGDPRTEFAQGETVTVLLNAIGTPTDQSKASIYEVNLSSTQAGTITPPAIGQRFNLRPGGTPTASHGLYPTQGFSYTFVMPNSAVTDLAMSFDVRHNLLGDAVNLPDAKASTVHPTNANRMASSAFNGLYNANNRWEAPANPAGGAANTPPVWLMVDLGATYDITDIVITWQSQNASSPSFEILLTDDSALWNDTRASGANANLSANPTPQIIQDWQDWLAEPGWNTAWSVSKTVNNADNISSELSAYAALSAGITTLLPWKTGPDAAGNFTGGRGDVTISTGGTGRYLVFTAPRNGNAGTSFSASIWEIEIFGAP